MEKIIIFNWKMNPNSLKEAALLFKQTQTYADLTQTNAETVVAAPFIYLEPLSKLLKAKSYKLRPKLGSQNVFWENQGAYTGEISVKMLKNLGVEYVIIGHSERRRYLNETDEMINKKVLAALKAGLKVILCLGENLTIRRRGIKAVKNFVRNQLEKNLKGIENWKLKIENLIIAYEPIWAIGTGNPCHPKDALEMIKFIKEWLNVKCQMSNVRVLYGGSVDGKNIKDFVKYQEIDGVLVGGASLKKEEVKEIIKICGKYPNKI